jgi:hypothetical protein
MRMPASAGTRRKAFGVLWLYYVGWWWRYEYVVPVARMTEMIRYYMLDSCVIQSSLPPYKIAAVQVQ